MTALLDDIITLPEELYTQADIARALNVGRKWVSAHRTNAGAPRHSFVVPTAGRGGREPVPLLLWTRSGLAQWRRYQQEPITRKAPPFSDLNAVNIVGGHRITWRLWWQNLPGGNTVWLFSTPQGWYASRDEGRSWKPTNCMRLCGDYVYFAVNYIRPDPTSAMVLRGATLVKKRIEAGDSEVEQTHSCNTPTGPQCWCEE